MDTQKFAVGPLSVLCILALALGTASAAAITATDSTSIPDTGPSHHQSPEVIIDTLELKGVDVTEVRTEVQNGDTAAVAAWLESYVHAHEGEMPYCQPEEPSP
jgi:hypothetical protein